MNYISVTELSEQWGVTPRYLQNLCKSGRLPGAVRMGKFWMLPFDVRRPKDRRLKGTTPDESGFALPDEVCWSVVGAAYHVPGTEGALLKALADNPEAGQLTKAQFAYLHGDINTCAELSGKLFCASDSFEIKIGSAFLSGLCALYNGDVSGWLNAKALIEKLYCPDSGYQARKDLWLAVFNTSIYDPAGYPAWFQRGCFDTLPAGYYPAARVHYIKYIYICGDVIVKNQPIDCKKLDERIFLLPAICEPLISQTKLDKAIVSEIYLRLLCASSYHFGGDDRLAVQHIDRAVALAVPDRIYAPFVEQRLNLDSLIDDRLRVLVPDALDKIRILNRKLMDGWTVVHNSVLNRNRSTELTAKELEAARLAAFGLTNSMIAGRMGISVNSVKGYLQTAKNKTGAKKRSDLAEFV